MPPKPPQPPEPEPTTGPGEPQPHGNRAGQGARSIWEYLWRDRQQKDWPPDLRRPSDLPREDSHKDDDVQDR